MNNIAIRTLENYIKAYENNREIKLSFVEPYIVRIRQLSYKEFCKNFKKPYDSIYFSIMTETARRLCKELPRM